MKPTDYVKICLRVTIAFIWGFTGVLCLTLSWNESLALLARTGISGPLGEWVVRLSCWLEILLCILTLVLQGWPLKGLLVLQGSMVVFFTLVISFYLPEQWLHPYAPIAKNVPLLGALVALFHLS